MTQTIRPLLAFSLILPLTFGTGFLPQQNQVHAAPSIQTGALSPLRIIIAPFKNISQAPKDDWLKDSFSESLTMGLLHVKALQLLERSQKS